ncbi:MAG: hypothetical protein K6T61_06200 [Bryobacteraceae bacterium]|nr:hypothetical protein [Bryobacteraceae bacterium]
MIRAVLYLFIAIILITFLRSVIGLIAKAFGGLMAEESQSAAAGGGSKGEGSTPAGELKRDPVCGTYVPESTSVKQLVGGRVVHFCSEECRSKYQSG